MHLADGDDFELDHGHVVIAAITSCTNTSNPQVMLAAGLLAKAAVERGVTVKPWVKTSLAPGSRVVMDYYERAGLIPYLEKLGFGLVGFGCTTCIGNSGPLAAEISAAIGEGNLAAVAVLSGNRNFEGRIHPDVRMNYLASPPLVVAYALAGTMDIDLYNEPLGVDENGEDVYLRDIWPSTEAVLETRPTGGAAGRLHVELRERVRPATSAGRLSRSRRASATPGTTRPTCKGRRTSTGWASSPSRSPTSSARAASRCSATRSRPTTSRRPGLPADEPGRQVARSSDGVAEADFNSFGARRGNHEVMVRGTFANARLQNALASKEGGWSVHLPDGTEDTIFDVAMRYAADKTPLIVIAGKEYGSGSSRDWAAKGPLLLGVRAAIAESFERIHRSNLIGMGVAPLQFLAGESAESLGLTGSEVFSIPGIEGSTAEELIGKEIHVDADGKHFHVTLRIDTLTEAEYFHHGGILHYVVRRLAQADA